ncbi:MAG: hypothetical protein ACRD82_13190 [Blastocatellia bacterium]
MGSCCLHRGARSAVRSQRRTLAWDFCDDGFGPLVLPGKYKVRLSAGGWNQTVPLEVTLNPRLAKDGVSVADLKEQFELLLAVLIAKSGAARWNTSMF